MSKYFNIYTAGFIDGEGSICLDRKNSKSIFRYPAIHITNTSKNILDEIKETYGGYIYKEKKRKQYHKQAWKLCLRDSIAVKCMKLILPYMKDPSKVRRAKLIVENYSTIFSKSAKVKDGYDVKRLKLEKEFFNKIN